MLMIWLSGSSVRLEIGFGLWVSPFVCFSAGVPVLLLFLPLLLRLWVSLIPTGVLVPVGFLSRFL